MVLARGSSACIGRSALRLCVARGLCREQLCVCRSVWTVLRCGPSHRLHSVAHGPDRLALPSAWARVVCGLQPRAASTKLLWRSVCFAVSCEFSIRMSVSLRRAARVWTLQVSVGTGLGVQLMLSLPTPDSGSVSSGLFRPLLSLSDIFAVFNVSEAGILILPYIRKRPGRCPGAGWGALRWLTCDLAGLRGWGGAGRGHSAPSRHRRLAH